MRRAALALLVLLGGLTPPARLSAQAPPLVAPTDPLSPADERKGFTVPAGFDVQLVASEPDIQKPMQLAFDAKGRMWVTTSYHYPFAAPQGKGTDKLFVLSGIDPATGKAKKVQVFADDLNIPIGILPLPDCKSCIVSSTGEIRKYTDTNDDGKADKMEVLFSGFGFVDTHGMTNSFTLMPDGWVYACHGFRNDSTVRGKDGHEVKMQSGHTFRFRPDGSRIEVYTRGQVNPFGIAVDPWFNLYTADCHSKPITQLIPGAYYESFGKPHDGLGFAAHVTKHSHNSTGLCGLAWYDAGHFPKEYQGTMFVGNVVTSRINFDRIEWHGATPVAKELPDFMTSKDLWFRPVDIKLGPDGALYVADFYNKIIGHYEVDLKHPGRDKDRGRIWRIVWVGKNGDAAPPKFHRYDFTTATDAQLLNDLVDQNLTVRMIAGQELIRRAKDGKTLEFNDNATLQLVANPKTVSFVVGWAAFTAEADKKPVPVADYRKIVDKAKETFKTSQQPDHFSTLVARALASRPKWEKDERAIALDILKSFDAPRLKRAVVEGIGYHPHADFVAPLVELLKKVPADDTHLRYAARVALRNCLRSDDKAWPRIVDPTKADIDPIYAEIALAIPSERSAAFLWELGAVRRLPAGVSTSAVLEHIARHGEWTMVERVADNLTRFPGSAPDPVLGFLRGVQTRGKRIKHKNGRELGSAMILELSQKRLDEPLKSVDADRCASMFRVLSALPGVVEGWSGTEVTPGAAKQMAAFCTTKTVPTDLRLVAAESLLKVAPASALGVLRPVLIDATVPAEFRDRLLLVFATSGSKEARLDARDSLKDAPYRTAVAVGVALAGTPAGAEDLLEAVKMGKAPARLLQEKLILERLRAAKIPDLDKQIGALTKGLPPLDQKLAELVKRRATAFASAKPDKELGAKLFTKHCAACHKIGEQGGKIAPQLDGIGTRGLERLLEDTLDPNRNVDQAFRARIITTKDERTITGLMLRVEGEVLVVADDQGKEIRVPLKDIGTNRETMLSPMPANFGEIIPEADFHHLMAYLLDQKARK
jgi:putative heme-binding domain-containing protein